jgi:hypothetical protein
VKYAFYMLAAFAVGLGIGKHAQLGTPPDTRLLQRCVDDLTHTLELLDQVMPPPSDPILVPALDDAQEGEIV